MAMAEHPYDAPPLQDEVDGVTVLHAPSRGLVRAGLVFRVGQADETLPTRGITHLVEHLALAALGKPAHEMNGSVDVLKTTFYTQGTPDEVAAFLTRIARLLADLPTDRLDVERRILRTEATSRATWPLGSLYAWRFGTRGHGTVAREEYGVRRVTADEVAAWARQRFTTENAILWVAGDVLDGIDLALPRGTRHPAPPLDPLPYEYPAWTREASPGVAMSVITETGPTGGMFHRLLDERARDHLRHERGLSYSVLSNADRLNKDLVHTAIWADGLPEDMPSVADGLVDTLKRLADEAVEQAELDKHNERFALHAALPDGVVPWLDVTAEAVLHGAEPRSRDQLVDGACGVTPDDVQAQARAALQSSLLIVPPDMDVTGGWSALIPEWSDAVLSGRTHPPVLGPGETADERGSLVIGKDGVSLVLGPDRRATVLYADMAAMLTWTDGSRYLLGPDGMAIFVRPEVWRDGEGAVKRIDAAVDASLVVPMGDPPVPPEQPPPPEKPQFSDRENLAHALLVIAATVAGVNGLASGDAGFTAVAVLALIALALLRLPLPLPRRLRR